MRIEVAVDSLRNALADSTKISLVPTMGNLHDGHLTLVREARHRVGATGTVVASIFVNRLQFGAGEDFDQYPRTFERDVARLREAGCDLLFAPDDTVMYPEPQTFRVMPDQQLSSILEGAARPGHFDGMCTVVLKLFAIVQPAFAIFGQKDFQQLLLVRAMVRQFALPIEVVACATVREADGLAMSSRNGYLDPAVRAEAVRLNRVLHAMATLIRAERALLAEGDESKLSLAQLPTIEGSGLRELEHHGWTPDYLAIRRQRDLLAPTEAELRGDEPLVALGAARLGTPRLLDNVGI